VEKLLGRRGSMFLKNYEGKRVFITGHTGFKGSWLTKILIESNAIVCGYALESEEISLFNQLGLRDKIEHNVGDIRDFNHLSEVFNQFQPEYVFHLAAQPLVLDSYQNPVYTYETNVLGTVYLLELVRLSKSVISVINVTTDKVYKNMEIDRGYIESDKLSGFDPYSNSKSCSELVSESYVNSFLLEKGIPLSTLRAGNVIGGGDYAKNRIIPDCVRSAVKNEPILVRNPNSIRPFQHVLEPLFVYLYLAYKQTLAKEIVGAYNVGPENSDCLKTSDLVTRFCAKWENISWYTVEQINVPHEAKLLKLDCSKLKNQLDWEPLLTIDKCLDLTIELSKSIEYKQDYISVVRKQISDYEVLFEKRIEK